MYILWCIFEKKSKKKDKMGQKQARNKKYLVFNLLVFHISFTFLVQAYLNLSKHVACRGCSASLVGCKKILPKHVIFERKLQIDVLVFNL